MTVAAPAPLFWQQERMHFPDPLTAMEIASIQRLSGGMTAVLRAFEAPLEAMRMEPFDGYLYQAAVPHLGTPEELAERGAAAEGRVRAALATLGADWAQRTLPEIRRHLAWWDAFDLTGAPTAAFVAHLDETWKRQARLWELHFLTVLPSYVAMSEFDELYRGLFEDADELDSYRLLEGLPNMTVEVGQALWRLSRRALAEPTVRDVLEREATADVVAALAGFDAGRAFLGELRTYLERYGQRGDRWGLTAPSWIEDPAPAIARLRDYIGRPDAEAPAVRTRAAAAGRDQAIVAARERLVGYPAAVAAQFEALLEAAQAGAVLSEDHNFWIDCAGVHRLRRVLVEAGRRLAAAGAVTRAEDVFHLEPEEARAALVGGGSLHEAVAERTATLERQRAVTPPAHLGTPPAGPPPDDPFSRLLTKFAGAPQAAFDRHDEIVGSAGSAGIVRGPVRIVRSIAEADGVEPGDVLVAETTAPPWTPLFATVAAVVTDTGGVLSHCAVVAREYGIPAVVGTAIATIAIADGQIVEVDGDLGLVRVL